MILVAGSTGLVGGMITRGLLDGTLIHPREIFREALAFGAYAFAVAHNHPSGDPAPSAADL